MLFLAAAVRRWIEAQAAIHNDLRHSQSTYSKSEFHLIDSQELHYKKSMRSISKSSVNRARQTPRRSSSSNRKDKRSHRSCSPAAFSSKGKGKDKDTSLTLRYHQKANFPTRERPGAWQKRPDKAAATSKRYQIVHSGPYRAP